MNDLTYSDSDGDWCICEESECGDPAYFAKFAEGDQQNNMEKQIGGLRLLAADQVNVRKITLDGTTPVILDSGADMSVLPLEYEKVGLALSRKSVLRDAQGNIMQGGALREALVELVDVNGTVVSIKETFALSNVSEPLLALGKLLKRGWKVEGHDGEVHLSFGDFSMVVQSRHNSLVAQAKIRAITAEGQQVGECQGGHHDFRWDDAQHDHSSRMAFIPQPPCSLPGGQQHQELQRLLSAIQQE